MQSFTRRGTRKPLASFSRTVSRLTPNSWPRGAIVFVDLIMIMMVMMIMIMTMTRMMAMITMARIPIVSLFEASEYKFEIMMTSLILSKRST